MRSKEFQRNQWVFHRHQLNDIISREKKKKKTSKTDAKKNSALTEDKMSSGQLDEVICMKNEVTRLANQELSLPVLKYGVEISVCTTFFGVKTASQQLS